MLPSEEPSEVLSVDDNMLSLRRNEGVPNAGRTNREERKINPEEEKKRKSGMTTVANLVTRRTRARKRGIGRKVALQLRRPLIRVRDLRNERVPLQERVKHGVGFITITSETRTPLVLANGAKRSVD